MDGRKREPRVGSDRVRKPRTGPTPVVHRRTMVLVLTLMSVSQALGVVGGPTPSRAQTGCGASLGQVQRTPGGLPHDSAEASGVVASPNHPGVAWMIRDSGHPPSLYALWFGPDGVAEAKEIPVEGASNKDWEDITYGYTSDGTGVLWVVESGQGGGGGRIVYEIAEPDPQTATTVRPLARYRYSYPDRSSNTEAAFTWDNHLVLVSKNFPAHVYIFESLSASGMNKPRYVGDLTDANGISVAKPSPDGRWLATATHETVSLYRNAGAPGTLEGFMNQEPFHVMVAAPEDNVEAGDFYPVGECQLLLLSETRNTYRLTE
ncbi:MAG: hypothetical protein ACRDZ3_03990 [Acidimicrobiia bacterium]